MEQYRVTFKHSTIRRRKTLSATWQRIRPSARKSPRPKSGGEVDTRRTAAEAYQPDFLDVHDGDWAGLRAEYTKLAGEYSRLSNTSGLELPAAPNELAALQPQMFTYDADDRISGDTSTPTATPSPLAASRTPTTCRASRGSGILTASNSWCLERSNSACSENCSYKSPGFPRDIRRYCEIKAARRTPHWGPFSNVVRRTHDTNSHLRPCPNGRLKIAAFKLGELAG